jgi:hypothetical protein
MISRFSIPTPVMATAAVLALAAVAGCGGEDEDESSARAGTGPGDVTAPNVRARPARFGSLPSGWRQFDGGVQALGPRGASTFTLATSWPYTESARGPASEIPKGGVLISVQLLRRAAAGRSSPALCDGGRPSPRYPDIERRPLRLPDKPSGELEGSAGIPEYRVSRGVRGEYNVEVRVAINQRDPSRAHLAQAQAVVDELLLPRWPTRC